MRISHLEFGLSFILYNKKFKHKTIFNLVYIKTFSIKPPVDLYIQERDTNAIGSNWIYICPCSNLFLTQHKIFPQEAINIPFSSDWCSHEKDEQNKWNLAQHLPQHYDRTNRMVQNTQNSQNKVVFGTLC